MCNFFFIFPGLQRRRATLRSQWYFDCFCGRCSDPSLDSSTKVNCQSCSSTLSPAYVGRQKALQWECTNSSCSYLSSHDVDQLEDRLQDEWQQLLKKSLLSLLDNVGSDNCTCSTTTTSKTGFLHNEII